MNYAIHVFPIFIYAAIAAFYFLKRRKYAYELQEILNDCKQEKITKKSRNSKLLILQLLYQRAKKRILFLGFTIVLLHAGVVIWKYLT